MSDRCPHGMCQHRVECEVEGGCVEALCRHCGHYESMCNCCQECGAQLVKHRSGSGFMYWYCRACEGEAGAL